MPGYVRKRGIQHHGNAGGIVEGSEGGSGCHQSFAIRVRLDDRVRFITDGRKPRLASSITYISNPEKDRAILFTSALNCSSVDTALSEMMETKQFGKMGGVLSYHFIQSAFSRGGHTRAGARYWAGICQAVVW